jgi:hypothetical protein
MATVFWSGPIPTECDTCETPITEIFYDAKTQYGSWANMCPSCHTLGPGLGKLGLGLGQKYEKQITGRFMKTKG